MTCDKFETDNQCVLHGANCIWGKEHPFDRTISCFDPCSSLADESVCDSVSYGYCTWRPDRNECFHRDKMRCSDFKAKSKCVNHGAHCGWNDSTNQCSLLRTMPTDPSICDKFNFPTKCIRSPRRVCAWDYDSRGSAYGVGKCVWKATMSCAGNKDATNCNSASHCSWDGSACTEKV